MTRQHLFLLAFASLTLRLSAQNAPADSIGSNRFFCGIHEQIPVYPGGTKALLAYLDENFRIPEDFEDCVCGRIIVNFYVEADGSVTDARVVRSLHPLLDQEALRVVSAMPRWHPGKLGGEPVRVRYSLPILVGLPPKADGGESVRQLDAMPSR